ncbi:MAG: N(4)-(beta-N-acetylglucosaminyl)-L-asparaginase [Pirellulales bacterium]
MPKVIASHNGVAATELAHRQILAGADVLEACVAGVGLVEDDPDDPTVGYGGLPNADGVVQLDAAVMHGPTHRVGAVAALERVRHAARVALTVMQRTDRVLLAGAGALQFALANGFAEEDLLTDKARKIWKYWQATSGGEWLPPDDVQLDPEVAAYVARHSERPRGTIYCGGVDQQGNLSSCTSTSGHAFKPPGRVGDSPICGAGLYVDNDVGSCGSVGHGENNMQNLSSFLAVEYMRRGLSPLDAGLAALRRAAEKCPPEDRDEQGRGTRDVRLFLLNKQGDHAAVCNRGPKRYAITDEQGSRLGECVPLYGA